jgi:hypothetical protein
VLAAANLFSGFNRAAIITDMGFPKVQVNSATGSLYNRKDTGSCLVSPIVQYVLATFSADVDRKKRRIEGGL